MVIDDSLECRDAIGKNQRETSSFVSRAVRGGIVALAQRRADGIGEARGADARAGVARTTAPHGATRTC